MVNMIKADFYKLFRKKSFYICGILGIALSVISIFLINSNFRNGSISPSLFGYTGLKALFYGLSSGGIFCTIMSSIFVSDEFSFGTIKNIISSGNSKVSVYISKMIIVLFVSCLYLLLFGISSFIVGSNLWGMPELTREDYLNIIRAIGLAILVEFSVQSVYIMISFLARKSSASVTINILMSMLVPSLLFPILNVGAYIWFKIENLQSEKCWPYTYLSNFLSLNIKTEDLLTGIGVCVATILISSVIGMISFMQKDIK